MQRQFILPLHLFYSRFFPVPGFEQSHEFDKKQ